VPTPSLFDQSPDEAAWPVSKLTQTAKRLVESQMAPVWVQGEVVGLKRYRSGHWYFGLRDAEAQVRCVMWRDDATRVKEMPAEGAKVFTFGSPTVWAERGEFRLTVRRLIPTEGLGLQQALLEQTRAALQADGLLDPARKRPLPRMATTVALVTSVDGAVLHDVVSVARKRWPTARILVIGTRVQGAGADIEVVAALRLVNRIDGIDVCIVARGGGGREDLAVFNVEAVCRALAEVRVPTVSAVGHETDISLTDLVADVRAATPSAAAELALADQDEVLRHAGALASRLAGGLSRRTRLAAERLNRAGDRLEGGLARVIRTRRQALDRLGVALDALSPLKVLQRGYGLALSPEGKVLRRRADFSDGTPFRLRLADGEVPARVEDR
jgi:exodeoxyribonuclease VII large subunit